MVIRRAERGDAGTVGRMRAAFLADHRGVAVEELGDGFVEATVSFVAHGHDAGTWRSWLAEDEDGSCLGIVSVRLFTMPPNPGDGRTLEGYLLNMYVVADARRRGIGQALFDRCLADCTELGVRRLFLRATEDGRPMYERAGFRDDGVWMDLRLDAG